MSKMKIIVAPDSFKGSLTAREAAEAIRKGVLSVMPDAEVVCVPIADGGEGTAECIADTLGAEWVSAMAVDPLGRILECAYPVMASSEGRTALIEVAEASGLTLVEESERDAMDATSFGTGLLVADAIRHGCRRVLLCLGGSATTDAGQGILEALGWRFGENVNDSEVSEAVWETRFEAACDVTNPLYGPDGTAYVFSPQKGASPEQVSALDERLHDFAKLTKEYLGKDFSKLPGAGAAGGIGFAVASYLNGKLRPGIEMVLDLIDFDTILKDADLVITGEGGIDRQTLGGKAPFGVMKRALARGIPTIALAGRVTDHILLQDAGFAKVECITPEYMPVSKAMKSETAKENLAKAAAAAIEELYL